MESFYFLIKKVIPASTSKLVKINFLPRAIFSFHSHVGDGRFNPTNQFQQCENCEGSAEMAASVGSTSKSISCATRSCLIKFLI